MEQNPPNDYSALVKYEYIVAKLERISKAKNKDGKVKILKECFEGILKKQQQFIDQKGQDANASFYPFLRLFIPAEDVERGAFGIQAKSLGPKYCQALGINVKSDKGKRLTNLQGNTTDFGDIVFDVMQNSSPSKSTLTVYQVNKYLDLISEHFKNNQRNKIENELLRMLMGSTALDRKWLTRTLLKKLNLGVGKQTILKLYHPKAEELYNQHSHLSRVCELIESKVPLDGDKIDFIEIFNPFRPMLCERGYISKINQMFSKNDYYLETKMDGERCQLHIRGTEFKYFSRRSKEDDLTKAFGASGELNARGLFSPFLSLHLKGKIKSAIFDGEMMVWDRQDEIYCNKAEKFTAKHLRPDDNRYNPCFCIYDLVYLDGDSLINKPYAERIRKLQTIVTEAKGALMLCHRTKVKNANHFLECLNKAFESGEEGVVIKQEDSTYKPGHRENGGWYKMKPDYENNLISDFDLLIIGGYYNDNRTAVDSFLLSVLKKGLDENDSRFYSVCKIRNGLSRSQFRQILEDLAPFKHEKGGFSNHESFGIEWANANPDFWYEPKRSIVVQIKASELTETTKYRTSHAFRFPRVIQIRRDKMWYDTCSFNEFQTFCASDSKVEKLMKRSATANDLTTGASVPKRKRNETATKATQSFALISNQVEAVDNVCQGREFCIVNQADKELENMVRRHGGRITAIPNSKTFVSIVSNPKSARAQPILKMKDHNVAKVEWLKRALGSDKPLTKLIKFTKDDMHFITPALQHEFDAELNAGDETDSEPMPTAEQPMDQTDENDEAAVENNGAQQDIFDQTALVEPDVSLSQNVRLLNMAKHGDLCMATNEPVATVLPEQPIVTNNEVQPDAVADPVYEEATQLMENEQVVDNVTNTCNEHENTDQSKSTDNEVVEMKQASNEPDEMDEMSIFRNCIAFFYRDESSAMDCDATFAQFMFTARGGVTLETVDDFRSSESRLTHIFVADDNFDRSKLKEAVTSFGTEQLENITVIRYQWILDCEEQMKRICDTSYKVNL